MKKKIISILVYCLIAPLVWLYLRTTLWLSKISVVNERNTNVLCEQQQGHIFVFWHNQQFIMPQLRPDRPIRPLVSDSRDGDYMAWLAKMFGKQPIRGSSSRKGVQALKKMIRLLKGGAELAIAIDGPRGPVFEVKPGAVQMAQMTGAPIVPVAYAATRHKKLGSWDHSFIPYPLGHLGIVYSDPIYIDRSMSIEQGVVLVKEALDQVNSDAQKLIET